MKRVVLELWMDDDEDVNDVSVGKALGIAIMTNSLTYIEDDDEPEAL